MKLNYLKVLMCGTLTAILSMGAFHAGSGPGDHIPERRSGMFEWNEERIYEMERVRELLHALPITDWYQETTVPVNHKDMAAFVEAMGNENVRVYALAGETEWGYEEDGASLIAWLKEIDRYNRKVGRDVAFCGVMVDIEPYTLKKWKDDVAANMKTYVNGMKEAYRYANDIGLDMIVCIPRHYDDQGQEEQLGVLIAEACDEVAVMDYDCGYEVEKIETEAKLAQKYGKALHCILEFQEVGKHELVEQKTYRNKGLGAADAAWDLVDLAYPDIGIVRDYHWSSPVFKMLEEGGDRS